MMELVAVKFVEEDVVVEELVAAFQVEVMEFVEKEGFVKLGLVFDHAQQPLNQGATTVFLLDIYKP